MGAKIWLVTGASTGLGRAIAIAALQAGHNVVATARRLDSLKPIGETFRKQALLCPLDVTDSAQRSNAVKAALEQFGSLDVLVNAAGYGLLSAVEEASDAEVRDQFEVNFFGLAALTRLALPIMRSNGEGVIVNLSSMVGVRAAPGNGYYAASKFAVEGLSEALAKEAAPLGVRVILAELGPFRTDFSGRSIVEPAQPIAAYKAAMEFRSMSRGFDGRQPGDPERAAVAIVRAAEDPASPLRLVLGKFAYDGIRETLTARLGELDSSKEIAAAADFPA